MACWLRVTHRLPRQPDLSRILPFAGSTKTAAGHRQRRGDVEGEASVSPMLTAPFYATVATMHTAPSL